MYNLFDRIMLSLICIGMIILMAISIHTCIGFSDWVDDTKTTIATYIGE